MSRMPESTGRRPRRQFDEDFKAQAVRLVLDEGKSVGAVARDLDLTESALRQWVERARADRTGGRTGLTSVERDELAKLRKENRELRMERDILKKPRPSSRSTKRKVRLDCHGEGHVPAAGALSGLGRHAQRLLCLAATSAVGPRASRRRARRTHPRAVHQGAPALWEPADHDDLREAGVPVSRKRVARLMRHAGLRARQRKRYRVTTMSEHDQPVAPNHLAQAFVAEAPNQRWVSDTTEFPIGTSGKLYLAAILDLYSRFVVGWAVSAVNDRQLTIKALDQALRRRGPSPGLLHHSDQGCTYASADYQRMLEARGLVCSMSRRGNCHDNAVAESFFSTLKSELADSFESFGEAKMELFDYIEVFYNQQRRHSTIGRISPAAFERRFAAQAA
jgi:putative transposase